MASSSIHANPVERVKGSRSLKANITFTVHVCTHRYRDRLIRVPIKQNSTLSMTSRIRLENVIASCPDLTANKEDKEQSPTRAKRVLLQAPDNTSESLAGDTQMNSKRIKISLGIRTCTATTNDYFYPFKVCCVVTEPSTQFQSTTNSSLLPLAMYVLSTCPLSSLNGRKRLHGNILIGKCDTRESITFRIFS